MRYVVNCQARSRPRAAGTRAGVLFVCWPASNGTIVANPKHLRVAGVASSRCVGSSSSNPSRCWLPLVIVEPRPRIRSCPRRSRRLRRGSVSAQGRSGNCECLGLRDARPSVLGYSFDSFPNRCLPIVARAFPRAYETHRSGSAPRSLAKLDLLSSSACRPLPEGRTR